MVTIERFQNAGPAGLHERLVIRSFQDCSAMHKFLNTGSNACVWKESSKGLKPGTYAFAGGRWHNIRSLDASILAHI